jgi:hypothetical protein
MSSTRPAAGGGHWVTVPPERLERWLAGFAERHGEPVLVEDHVHHAVDGATAQIELPYPDDGAATIEQALRVRTVGVLLVRRGGHAAGIFHGAELVVSKVGGRHVQGRTAAGGWSQQRFARRRANQTNAAVEAAADDAVMILLSRPIEALRTGGDRDLVTQVLADKRLAPVRDLVTGPFLDVPDPRLAVLKKVRLRDVRIRVVEP